MVRSGLLFLATILFGFAAHAALLFGPERAISGVEYAPPLGIQRPDSVASDGNDFLAVWNDREYGRYGIYATRINAAGESRPDTQILIRRGVSALASVVWNGSAYLVFWSEGADAELMMATVSREGRLAGPPRVLRSGATPWRHAVAAGGTQVMVAYTLLSQPPNLRALILDGSGAVVRDVLVETEINAFDSASVASDGSSFVVTYARLTPSSGTQLIAARFAADGAFLMRRQVLADNFVDAVDIAYGGGTYVVVVRRAGLIAALRIDPATLEPSAPVTLGINGFDPSILFTGSEFVAYWFTFDGLQTAVFRAGDTTATVASPIDSEGAQLPRFAWNGRNILAIWHDHRYAAANTGSGDVFAALLDRSARSTASDHVTVAFAPAGQTLPAIATSGLESWVVWIEQLTDAKKGRLLAARIEANGFIAAPVELAAEAVAGFQPRIVFTGSAYFVVWQERVGDLLTIAGRRLERDGLRGPVLSLGDGYVPAVAANGTTTLVVFQRNADIVGVRLDAESAVIDLAPLTIAAKRSGFQPNVATNGSDFLVVWTEGSDWWQFPSPGLRDVYGARVSGNGAVDAAPIAIAAGKPNQFGATVASDGRDFLVTYHLTLNFTDFGAPVELAAVRVLREGQISGLSEATDGTVIGTGRNPHLTRDANGYLASYVSDEGVHVARLDAAGRRVESIATIAAPGAGTAASVVSGGVVQLVCTRLFEDSVASAAERVFIRTGRDGPGRSRSARH